MKNNIRRTLVFILAFFISLFLSVELFSKDIPFKFIAIEKVSRYIEDRIAFQHIQFGESNKLDDSMANLLVINDRQMYLLRDGFDDAKEVEMQRYIFEVRRKIYGSLWKNKVNSKPDYIKITDRRVERMVNVTEDFVNKNFGQFYQNVRNSFINKHVNVFKNLMTHREDSQLTVKRSPISPPVFMAADEKAARFYTRVTGRTVDEKIYLAEDADGDGITETFSVHLNDGFHWGYKSGPNILFIYKNKEEDIKQLIGKLAHNAYFGTSEEEKMILSKFPSDNEIMKVHKLDKITLKVDNTKKETKTETTQ